MTKSNWTSSLHLKKGALRKTLGVKTGQKIPVAKLKSVAKGSGITAKRARLALTFRKMNSK